MIGELNIDTGVKVDLSDLTGDVTNTGNPIGGLIGCMNMSNNSEVSFIRCKNIAEIRTGGATAGGFVGIVSASKSSTIRFYRCLQDAVLYDVRFYGYDGGSVGGFIGTASNGNYFFNECAVAGEVWYGAYGQECGGFIGKATPHSISFSDCEVFAYINSRHTNGDTSLGGLVSGCYQDNYDENSVWDIRNVFVSSVMVNAYCQAALVSNYEKNGTALRNFTVNNCFFDNSKVNQSILPNDGLLRWSAIFSGRNTISDHVYNSSGFSSYKLRTDHSLYCNWDMENVWMYAASGYPMLRAFDVEACVDHDYAVLTTPATCTQTGTKEYTCSTCKYSYTQTLAALGHAEGRWVITSAPPVSGVGTYDYICPRCGVALQSKNIYLDAEGVYWVYKVNGGIAELLETFSNKEDVKAIKTPAYIDGRPVVSLLSGVLNGVKGIETVSVAETVVSIAADVFSSIETLVAINFPFENHIIYSEIEAENTNVIAGNKNWQNIPTGRICVSDLGDLNFNIFVNKSGVFTLSEAAYLNKSGRYFDMYVDGKLIGSYAPSLGDGYTHFEVARVFLDEGIHKVEFKQFQQSAAPIIDYFRISPVDGGEAYIENGRNYYPCSNINNSIENISGDVFYNCYQGTNAQTVLENNNRNYSLLNVFADTVYFAIENPLYVTKNNYMYVRPLCSPENATDIFEWSVSNTDCFSIDATSGLLFAKEVGETDVMVTTYNNAVAVYHVCSVPFDDCEYTEFDCVLINNDSEVKITGYRGTDVNLVIPETLGGKPVTEIGENAIPEFAESIIIPSSVKMVNYTAFANATALKEINVSVENESFSSKNGILFSKDGTQVVRCPMAIENKTIYFDGIETVIGSYAFAKCGLTSVILPDSLEFIGSYAFKENDFTTLTIPKSVTTIERNSFEQCKNLRIVNYNAIYAQTGITTNIFAPILVPMNAIFRYDSEIETINIGPKVKSLPTGLVAGLEGLKAINIAADAELNLVEKYSFVNDSALTDVYYDGYYKEWKQISISDNNAPLVDATLHCIECDECEWDTGVITTEPTCISTGVMLITCQICGKERIETIDALGHDVSTEWIIDKEPTCTESGSKSHHCSRCDLTTDVTVIDAIGHSWDKGEITTPATCTETGIRTFTCSACQETRTEIIDEIGHDFGNWTEVDENQHQRICKNDSSHVEKENHSWNDGVVTQAASCTEAGIRTYTCSVCGATKTSTINAFSHEYGSWTKFDDNQHQRICENDSSHVEKENHSWNGGTVTKATTCTEMGIRTFTCTVCGAKKTESIKATGHNYGAWTIVKAPTCTSEGVEQRVCRNDTKHVETRPIAKSAHADNDGDGYCDNCHTDLGSGGETHESNCVCGKYHTGPFAGIVKFFHRIVYFFKNLFGIN